MSGFLWGSHRKEQTLPAVAVSRHQVVFTHTVTERFKLRQRNTPVFFKSVGASLLPFKWSSHPTCTICISLCRSLSAQNTMNLQAGITKEAAKGLLKPVRNSPVREREKGKDGEKGIAVSRGELWQCGEMRLRKRWWSSMAVEDLQKEVLRDRLLEKQRVRHCIESKRL